MISFSVKLCVLFRAFLVVKGTLTPDGPVPLDCGNKETFICNVTGVAAQWTISGLSGISVTRDNGLGVANNPRITTTDTSGATTSSTITITGFTTADNEGTIQCINLDDNSVQGMANISVGAPLCPSTMVVHAGADVATVTWQQPPNTPPVLSTIVTYCPTSSLNCTISTECATNPCIMGGLGPRTLYNFTITQSNNCGLVPGCAGENSTAETACFCSLCTSEPPSVLLTTLAGTIPSAFLIMVNIISVVVTILITRWCASQKGSPSKGEDAYEQVKEPKTYEDIQMTSSPAYGPVK